MLALVLTCSSATASASNGIPDEDAVSFNVIACPQGHHFQPGGRKAGPFEVIVACRNTLIGDVEVVCSDPRFCDKKEIPGRYTGWNWTPNSSNMEWSDKRWSTNATGFAWSRFGNSLYISTSKNFGSGGIFVLNLEGRTSRQLLPLGEQVSIEHRGPGYRILSIDPDGRRLHYEIAGSSDEHTMELDEADR